MLSLFPRNTGIYLGVHTVDDQHQHVRSHEDHKSHTGMLLLRTLKKMEQPVFCPVSHVTYHIAAWKQETTFNGTQK
jgi:hypothetical protein